METVKIYLSGGMGNLDWEEQSVWRSKVIEEIKNRDREKSVNFFNPVNYYNFKEKRQKTEYEVMEFDLNALRHSDLILVNFNDPNSLGTCAELAIAYEMKIPIVGVNENGHKLHPWLECFCGRICDNLEEAVSYIVEFYLN